MARPKYDPDGIRVVLNGWGGIDGVFVGDTDLSRYIIANNCILNSLSAVAHGCMTTLDVRLVVGSVEMKNPPTDSTNKGLEE